MCSVLPLKKRPVVTSSPLDLTLKKKKSTTPERVVKQTPSVSSSSSLDISSFSLDMQLQLALLSQQLYLGLLSSAALPPLLPTPLPTHTLPILTTKVTSPQLTIEPRKLSTTSKNSSPGEDKRCEANARERNRVQNLGVQFEKLRSLLPVEEQRLSKLTVLKVARAYIAYLAVLSSSESDLEMEAAGIVFSATAHQEMQPRR
ncbi:hypothetical protein PENTCL1PPCAC_14583 [Pristionchus entomophagus]|uniref:BHLH domain-containing protein n=1 Tax=Pristionchus entomophagus TaxID=358040 RepID=A0AAV5TE41_9BILA|nr:hypothetical protein PENTCL1PPCAC_14583 [Pristionchus entomophagus]